MGGGSTNLGSEKSGPAGRGLPKEQPGPDPREEGDWAKIYAPKITEGTDFEDLLSKRKMGEGPMKGKKLIRGKPEKKEDATVPYEEVLPSYRESMEKALNEGSIPSEYRDQVKEYFESLDRR